MAARSPNPVEPTLTSAEPTSPALAVSPTPAASPASPASKLGFEKWLGFLTSFVAPLTFFTGLLFYFGYVSSRAYFSYFGVDVDVLGLSSQEFVMRSPGALFIPVTLLLLLAVVLIVAHRVVRRWMNRTSSARVRRVIRVLAITGAALILAGIAAAFLLPVLGDWILYPFLTPLLLALGAGLAAYAAAIDRAGETEGGNRSVIVLLAVVMVAATFWTTATVAEWWGRGEARTLAADLSDLPAVVLDAPERLFPGDDAIRFQELEPHEEGQVFRYRYYGLRMLVRGGNRLFLVPDRWSANASTLVVPFDNSVRLRFRFFPDANPPTTGP